MLKLPSKSEIKSAISSFSKKEWIAFGILAAILLGSTLGILEKINTSFMVQMPSRGGSLSEGIIGSPRFVNPILALSDADRDLVSLVYSGLLRKSPDGTLIPDLAENYTVSKDGLTYTFTLKNNIYFQDGKPITADDVVFTINEAKDPIIKSPIKGNWDGVTATKIDDKTVQFVLKQPYASFLENATIGIMPEHIWSGSPIELNNANTNPIGSGPYQVSSVSKESSGIIDYYELAPFKKFILGEPYIGKITLKFYTNENDLLTALQNGDVDQLSSITPEDAATLTSKGYRIESSILPRVFGLFFNQTQAQIFTDANVVKAMDLAVDKDRIIKEVLSGYGVPIDAPIPPNLSTDYERLGAENTASMADNIKQAQAILSKDGWVAGADGTLQKTTTDKKTKKKVTVPLEFSISTGNAPELAQTAAILEQNFQAIGMKVDVKTFEVGNLNQFVIRPRKYDALLFGEIINNESDLFAFWHSSQRTDPGLNVAMYANAKVDKILESALVTLDDKTRDQEYAQFETQIKMDMPAIFLYSPDFIYVVSKDLSGLSIDHMTSPSDRFSNVYAWYVKTENVWKVFAK